MGRRGNIIIEALLVLALGCWAVGCIVFVLTDAVAGAFGVAQGCFFMAWAVYLEAYSHRG